MSIKIKHLTIKTTLLFNFFAASNNSLFEAAKIGDVKKIDTVLLDKNVEIDSVDSDQESALIIACKNNQFEAAKYLIERGADLNLRNKNGETALIHVALKKNYELLKFLLDNKADPNIKNNFGCTSILSAVASNFIKGIKLLIEHGADVNTKTKESLSVLDYAVFSNLPEVLAFLLKYKIESEILDKALIVCLLKKQSPEVTKLLLEKGANPNAMYISNQSPFLIACINNDTKNIKLMLEYCVDVNAEDCFGKNALSYAFDNHNKRIFKLLISAGSCIRLKNLNSNSLQALYKNKKLLDFFSSHINFFSFLSKELYLNMNSLSDSKKDESDSIEGENNDFKAIVNSKKTNGVKFTFIFNKLIKEIENNGIDSNKRRILLTMIRSIAKKYLFSEKTMTTGSVCIPDEIAEKIFVERLKLTDPLIAKHLHKEIVLASGGCETILNLISQEASRLHQKLINNRIKNVAGCSSSS